MENLTIGKLAGQVGVETLGYFERRELIEPQSRTESGYRLYNIDTRQCLRFITVATAGCSILATLKQGGSEDTEGTDR